MALGGGAALRNIRRRGVNPRAADPTRLWRALVRTVAVLSPAHQRGRSAWLASLLRGRAFQRSRAPADPTVPRGTRAALEEGRAAQRAEPNAGSAAAAFANAQRAAGRAE